MKVIVTGGSGFIGVSMVSNLLKSKHVVANLDVRPPLDSSQTNYWVKGDIMDPVGMQKTFDDFQPDAVIHLAARVECDENTTVEKGYQLNVKGTKNVLDVIKGCGSVKRLILVSTQFVCGPGRLPDSDEDFYPHTVYGQSKVETEKMIRSADLACEWVIVRPVNIWGPYHERYQREFWKIASSGLYFHPGMPSPTRTYGYVGNVVWQMMQMLDAKSNVVDRQVFYVGDQPISIDKWVMGFCKGFRGKLPLVIPMWLITLLARCGDVISKLTGKPFYINSSRLKNMVEDYYAPMDKTFETFGPPPYTLEQGIDESVEWYRSRK